ncbi:MAG: dihydroorotate dehydrogenase [Alphaproteobacteria bacterium]
MTDLKTNLSGIELENPFVLASGILGTTASLLARAADMGAGAVTCKSVSTEARPGHKNPICFDWGKGLLNAVGLPGSGAAKNAELITAYKKETKTPIIGSFFANTPEEFASVAKTIMAGKPDMMEVNISCPNVRDEFGVPFAASIPDAVSVVQAIRPVCDVPLFIKLAPNVPNIAQIAKAVIAAGADGITAINTMPGMVIDIDSGHPVLTNKMGGLSGAAIRPIAVQCIYAIRAALPDVPIIGTGGVVNGRDAAELLMAGATAVGIGSAVYYRGVEAFELIAGELTEFMQEKGYESLDDFRNLAHKKVKETR